MIQEKTFITEIYTFFLFFTHFVFKNCTKFLSVLFRILVGDFRNKLGSIFDQWQWQIFVQGGKFCKHITVRLRGHKFALQDIISYFPEKGDKKTNKKKNSAAQFKIENGPTFNALIKLLIEKLEPALSKLFKGAKKLSDLQKAKNWKPLNKWLKRYTGDLCKFLGAVSEASVISALLKHIHGLVLYFAALPKSAKFLSKQLIHLWSTHEEESVRVLALMAVRKKIYE